MKPSFLGIAVAVALGMAGEAALATRLDVRYLRLDDLPAVLASTRGDPSAWNTPVSLKGMTLIQAAQSVNPVIAWVPASALAPLGARADALDIVLSGVSLLVTATPGESRYEASVFGVQATTASVLYQPLPDGTLHLHLFDDNADALAEGRIAQAIVGDAHELIRNTAGHPAAVAAGRPGNVLMAFTASQDAPAQQVPTKLWGASKNDRNGARIALMATVTRDISRTHDSKLITVKTEAEVIPHQRGLDKKIPFALAWLPVWPINLIPNGPGIYVPGEYGISNWVEWPEDEAPNVRLLSYHPTTDGSTDRHVVDKHVTTSTWGVSVSPEASRGLTDGKVSASGKVAASFSYSESKTDEQSVTMTLKDYSTAFNEFATENQTEAAWRFPLADDIAGNTSYFGKPATVRNRTPMMKQAGLQTAATWRVDGTYEGLLKVTGAATVRNRYFHHQSEKTYDVADCSRKVDVTDSRPCDVSVLGSRGPADQRTFVATAQPSVEIVMDLSTPYLTRTPTVLLQSLSGANGCITQAATASDEVTMGTCDRTEGNRSQQWLFDEAGRYVNRGSGMCLDMDPGDGHLRATSCSQALNQRWEWRADRIHSATDGGKPRLYVNGPSVAGAFRPSRDPLVPVNATNALLPPWTSYPLKPRRGDLIPGFNFNAAPIPDSYLSFADIDASQRWATIPLIFGIP